MYLGFPIYSQMGEGGLNAQRKIPITRADYFQQRIMCSDKRFAGNTEYLFYGLSEVEKQRVEQKINVCCKIRSASRSTSAA